MSEEAAAAQDNESANFATQKPKPAGSAGLSKATSAVLALAAMVSSSKPARTAPPLDNSHNWRPNIERELADLQASGEAALSIPGEADREAQEEAGGDLVILPRPIRA